MRSRQPEQWPHSNDSAQGDTASPKPQIPHLQSGASVCESRPWARLDLPPFLICARYEMEHYIFALSQVCAASNTHGIAGRIRSHDTECVRKLPRRSRQRRLSAQHSARRRAGLGAWRCKKSRGSTASDRQPIAGASGRRGLGVGAPRRSSGRCSWGRRSIHALTRSGNKTCQPWKRLRNSIAFSRGTGWKTVNSCGRRLSQR